MDKATGWYGNNNSRYDGKAFLDSVSKLHREEICRATWSLQVSWYLSQSRDYGKPLLWLATRGQPNWEEENQMRMKLSKVQLHDSLFAVRW